MLKNFQSLIHSERQQQMEAGNLREMLTFWIPFLFHRTILAANRKLPLKYMQIYFSLNGVQTKLTGC
jgi:hypothetical protein